MRDALDQQLAELLQKIMQMGGLAERMIGRAVDGLFDGDETAIDDVAALEREVNRLQLDIDEQAVRVTVHQQPVARDVRLVFVASRCATDVERIADQAVNISQSAGYVHADSDALAPPERLREMADLARELVGDALMALVTRDVSLAESVLEREPRVDALRDADLPRAAAGDDRRPARRRGRRCR